MRVGVQGHQGRYYIALVGGREVHGDAVSLIDADGLAGGFRIRGVKGSAGHVSVDRGGKHWTARSYGCGSCSSGSCCCRRCGSCRSSCRQARKIIMGDPGGRISVDC